MVKWPHRWGLSYFLGGQGKEEAVAEFVDVYFHQWISLNILPKPISLILDLIIRGLT